MEGTAGRIVIGEADRAHLARAAKWSKFLAIVQFIGIGLMFVFALIMLLAGGVTKASLAEVPGWSEMPSGFFTWYAIFIIVMLVISFFLALYLYCFATKTLSAIREGNDATMTEAFANLGQYFRIYGILTIVMLGLCVLAIVITIIAGIVAAAII